MDVRYEGVIGSCCLFLYIQFLGEIHFLQFKLMQNWKYPNFLFFYDV